MQPLFRLLDSAPRDGWGPKQQGGLRSALADRQWPQGRLHSCGMVASPNCLLCVRYGYCSAEDTAYQHRGTLFHRIWTRPVLDAERRRLVPAWLLDEVQRALLSDGGMTPHDLLLHTRALTPSPRAMVPPPPTEESFEWVTPPEDGDVGVGGVFYVDGSMLDAEWRLAGACARRGWAFVVANDTGRIIAAARGRPPAWASGIHGAELWGLVMAAMSAFPPSKFKVDCLSVKDGAQRGSEWGTSPERRLARAWGPLVR